MANVVLPRVRMFIPCLGLDLEPGLARTIYGPLHTIRMPPGIDKNYEVDEIWFYVVLTDAVETFRLKVEMVGDAGNVLARSEPQLATFSGGNQLNAREFGFQLCSIPFPSAGLYEFRLVANHAHLQEGGTENAARLICQGKKRPRRK
jgi:hypothetical protein